MSDKKEKDEFIWAALLHLGMNMWHDQKAPLKPARDFKEWTSRCPKNVIASWAMYGRTYDVAKVDVERHKEMIPRYKKLDDEGYDQIPCGTTWVPGHYAKYHLQQNDVNFPLTVAHCRSVISPVRLKDFLMAPWMPTDTKNRNILLHSIDLVGQSMKI